MSMQQFHFKPAVQPPGRRQAPRLRLALPGKLVLITGQEPCILDDLSQRGACVRMGGAAPRIGEDVVLRVQQVEAFGRVVWRSGSSFGMAFDEPLDSFEVVQLRAIHDHFQVLEQQEVRRKAREFVVGRRAL